MDVRLRDDILEVRLAWWEKALGLMGDIRVARADVHDVELLDDGVADAMSAGLKAGLRLPWVRYVCRSLKLDRAWVVRRGQPALRLRVSNHGHLAQVTVSTPDAAALAAQLRGP